MALWTGGILILVVLAAWALLRTGIIRPIARIEAFASDMAEGDFSRRVDIDSGDEIGHLARALNGMADRLREVVTRVLAGASHVAASSGEMHSTADSSRAGPPARPHGIEEVSASVEQMTSASCRTRRTPPRPSAWPPRPPPTQNQRRARAHDRQRHETDRREDRRRR